MQVVDVSRQRERSAEESYQQRSRSLIVKSARSQPAEASTRQKRTRRESEAEIPSRRIPISEMELESAHVNLNEDSNVQLCPTNHRA